MESLSSMDTDTIRQYPQIVIDICVLDILCLSHPQDSLTVEWSS